jgi:hypothetical protein
MTECVVARFCFSLWVKRRWTSVQVEQATSSVEILVRTRLKDLGSSKLAKAIFLVVHETKEGASGRRLETSE